MSEKNNAELVAQTQTGMDAFLAISNAFMLGQERLSMLNAAAIRDSVGDAAKLAKLLAEVKEGQDIQTICSSISNGLFARATEYTKDVLQIATETQTAIGKLQQFKLPVVSSSSEAAEIWRQTLGAVVKSAPDWGQVPFLPSAPKSGNSKHAAPAA
jgi:phasin family protein